MQKHKCRNTNFCLKMSRRAFWTKVGEEGCFVDAIIDRKLCYLLRWPKGGNSFSAKDFVNVPVMLFIQFYKV